jgi:hypothetical protein
MESLESEIDPIEILPELQCQLPVKVSFGIQAEFMGSSELMGSLEAEIDPIEILPELQCQLPIKVSLIEV